MITNDVSTCPKCGGDLKYYDRVTRIVRTKGRKTWKIPMRRLQCTRCGSVHRELPELIFPYKQYEAEVIIGVLEGFITCETIGFEDYVGLTSSQLAALVKDPVLEILEDGLTDYRYSIRYGELIALNTHMIQKLYQMVEELLQQKEG